MASILIHFSWKQGRLMIILWGKGHLLFAPMGLQHWIILHYEPLNQKSMSVKFATNIFKTLQLFDVFVTYHSVLFCIQDVYMWSKAQFLGWNIFLNSLGPFHLSLGTGPTCPLLSNLNTQAENTVSIISLFYSTHWHCRHDILQLCQVIFVFKFLYNFL
jgi:hypothetical protein